MRKIDDYIDKIYKGFDDKSEDVQILKEEMRVHLYDMVHDLMEEGNSEVESIEIAINSFGDEKGFSSEIETIITKQKKYNSIILKICLVIFIIGTLIKISGWYAERVYTENWNRNRQMTYNDVIDEIHKVLGEKSDLTGVEKDKIDKILNKYNDNYENGLYYIRILKNNNPCYEYERNVSQDTIKNENSGGTGDNNGWRIEKKQTDVDSLRCSIVWNERYDIPKLTNTKHSRLNNIGFWLITLSWVMMVIYLTQKAVLMENSIKNLIILLSSETIIMFVFFSVDKDFLPLMVAVFMIINLLFSKSKSKSFKNKVAIG